MFSVAQYEAVIAEIEQGTKTFEAKLAEVIPAAESVSSQWYVGEVIGEMLEWIAQKTVELGTEILNFILDVLKGATAPIFMFIDSYQWTDFKAAANGVSADLTTQNLVIDDSDWSGKGHDSYLTTAAAQSAAATRIGSIAKTTSDNLLYCAGAGLAFYIVVAGVIAKLIVEVVAATTAISTAVFSVLGAMIFLESASSTSPPSQRPSAYSPHSWAPRSTPWSPCTARPPIPPASRTAHGRARIPPSTTTPRSRTATRTGP